jgi:UDP-GlcNAc:undecaprenyl-phosphate GlcNAc-1-phosphate transferase
VVPLVFAERRGWRPHGGDPQSHLGGWIVAIKEHPALRALALKFITLTVPVYIIGTSLWAQDAQEFGSLSAVLGMAMTAGLLLNNREPRLEWLVAGFKEHPVLHALSLKSVTLIIPYIRRGIVYVMAILAVYLPIQPPMLDTLVLIYFMVLAVAVGFIIRSVEDEMFKTTPMDYLLLFSLLTIVILGGRYLEIQAMELFMVKSVILLYGCEILLERRERYGNSLNISTATALGILGSRGLLL